MHVTGWNEGVNARDLLARAAERCKERSCTSARRGESDVQTLRDWLLASVSCIAARESSRTVRIVSRFLPPSVQTALLQGKQEGPVSEWSGVKEWMDWMSDRLADDSLAWLYVLFSPDSSIYYVGSTAHLHGRHMEHMHKMHHPFPTDLRVCGSAVRQPVRLERRYRVWRRHNADSLHFLPLLPHPQLHVVREIERAIIHAYQPKGNVYDNPCPHFAARGFHVAFVGGGVRRDRPGSWRRRRMDDDSLSTHLHANMYRKGLESSLVDRVVCRLRKVPPSAHAPPGFDPFPAHEPWQPAALLCLSLPTPFAFSKHTWRWGDYSQAVQAWQERHPGRSVDLYADSSCASLLVCFAAEKKSRVEWKRVSGDSLFRLLRLGNRLRVWGRKVLFLRRLSGVFRQRGLIWPVRTKLRVPASVFVTARLRAHLRGVVLAQGVGSERCRAILSSTSFCNSPARSYWRVLCNHIAYAKSVSEEEIAMADTSFPLPDSACARIEDNMALPAIHDMYREHDALVRELRVWADTNAIDLPDSLLFSIVTDCSRPLKCVTMEEMEVADRITRVAGHASEDRICVPLDKNSKRALVCTREAYCGMLRRSVIDHPNFERTEWSPEEAIHAMKDDLVRTMGKDWLSLCRKGWHVRNLPYAYVLPKDKCYGAHGCSKQHAHERIIMSFICSPTRFLLRMASRAL